MFSVRDYTRSAFLGVSLAVSVTACTGTTPDILRLAQQSETFSTTQTVNTKVDLLWVVDNSASMDVQQKKLREGFSAFATKYMQPTWDIRVAVIPTDVYLANSYWTSYLDRTIPGTVGAHSSIVDAKATAGSWINPVWNTLLVNLTPGPNLGAFTNGLKYKELIPVWGPNYSKLLPGNHDGPIPGLCSELLPYFASTQSGSPNCQVRDSGATGTTNCLNPASGQDSSSQCVNTIQNDTVRSGKAIVKTMPPTGTAGDQVWIDRLIDDFMVNVTTGTAGQGSERGFSSVLQMLADNEGTATSFFRAGAVHGIIFISDEDDQSVTDPTSPASDYHPMWEYSCDQAGLIALNNGSPNPVKNISGANGYCCTGAGCSYGAHANTGTTCPAKTIDGNSWTVSVCPRTSKLIPVSGSSSVKSQLDTFFTALEGGNVALMNYFVVSIVPTTWASVQAIQTARVASDVANGQIVQRAVDRGDRYMDLVTQVGNGSFTMDINLANYTTILNAIGNAVIAKKGTFELTRAPTGLEDLKVYVVHQDGSKSLVSSSIYTISGSQIVISDINFILSLKATDSILISYEPKTIT
jgi:hypothetical protein